MDREIRHIPESPWLTSAAVTCMLFSLGSDFLGTFEALTRVFDSVAVAFFTAGTLIALSTNVATLEAVLEAPSAPGTDGRLVRLAAAATITFLFFWSLTLRDAGMGDGSVQPLVTLMSLVLVMASGHSSRRDREESIPAIAM